MFAVFDMSNSSTPSRTRPALVIPGLENTSHFDGKAWMMSSYGLPTPPQSATALESRRPSLQFSMMAEHAASAGSTGGAFSQPSTLVRSVNRQCEPSGHSWAEHAATTTNTPTNLVHGLSATHLSQPLMQPAFQTHDAYQDIDYMGVYADGTASHTTDVFANTMDVSTQSAWSASQHVPHSMTAEVSSSFGPPLFAMSQTLGAENNTQGVCEIQSGSTFQHRYDQSVESFRGYIAGPSSINNQPQVVVPSQLSPQNDLSGRQFHGLPSMYDVTGGYSSSFGSSTGTLDDFEMVRPPSPLSHYFAQSDEEDYVHIQNFESPSYNASTRVTAGSRTRRRGSRRVRNTTSNWTITHHIGNTEVVCENFNPIEGPPPVRKGSQGKMFRCTHKCANGMECTAKFARGEHLKRHAGKHSNVRLYPCPLPKCTKEIQRPDNAADHFKTHLRPPKRGKRNPHFDWPVVKRAIETAYTDKKRAGKLLENLKKWIEAGMPESPSQRRGARYA